jgi:hypothetical protein
MAGSSDNILPRGKGEEPIDCEDTESCIIPTEPKECVILYAECDY